MRDSINNEEINEEVRNKSNSERNLRDPLADNKTLTFSDDAVFQNRDRNVTLNKKSKTYEWRCFKLIYFI